MNLAEQLAKVRADIAFRCQVVQTLTQVGIHVPYTARDLDAHHARVNAQANRLYDDLARERALEEQEGAP